MKKIVLALVAMLILTISVSAYSAEQVKVEVLYMNHGPLQNTIGQLKKIFASYGSKLNVSWHDFDTDDGARFMSSKGIKQHVPLIIWIDGRSKVLVGSKEISFNGFPTGSGPAFFQGKWTMADVKGALNQTTGKK
jgi:hypothetical protein